VAQLGQHAHLLKVRHHGSATSTTPEILAAAKPTFALISVGDHPSFGLPKPDVLARLQAVGVNVYRTHLNGPVTFYLAGHSVTIRHQLKFCWVGFSYAARIAELDRSYIRTRLSKDVKLNLCPLL
jgi:beta-lactamase superfamily II metal-dependent hydrolase